MQDDIKKRLRMINICGMAGVLVLLAGAGAFGVTPMWRGGVQSIREAADYKAKLTELDALTLKVARVHEEQKSREARLKNAEALLPSLASVNQFVPDLGKVAEAAGLDVDKVAPLKELKDAGEYKLMSVQISGRGDWDTCYKFLTGLRSGNRKLTRLDNLTLEVDRDRTNEKPLCRLTVDISTLMAR